MMKKAIYLLALVAIFSSFGCKNKNTDKSIENDNVSDTIFMPPTTEVVYGNSVKGHTEERVIVGNFTGIGIDTIYVDKVINEGAITYDENVKYYAKSNNPDIPSIELFGYYGCSPLLVYEGDVDGDGKDEWGYLHTWMTSQWRQYRIYNYDNKRKEWRFLYYDTDINSQQLLNTSEYVRGSGVDIVEKGPRSGLIKINYDTESSKHEIRDTIVEPTYTPISRDAW